MQEEGKRLHPACGAAFAIAGLALAYGGHRVVPTLGGIALALLGPRRRGLVAIYAWLAIPVAVIVGLAHGPLEGADSAIGVLAVTAPLSALTLVPPRWIAYTLWRAGLRGTAAYFPVFVLRLADHMWEVAREALAAMRGRGMRGARAVAAAFIPVVVYGFQSSVYLAEALYFKAPRPGKTWADRPRLGAWDAVVCGMLGLMVLASQFCPC